MSKSQTIKVFLMNTLVLTSIFGQDISYPPPTTLVTMPTAGTLVRGSFAMEMRVQKRGGMSTALQVGITDRFQFGSSFGASNLIGDDSLRWYPRPEVNLKYRLIDETTSMPGVSLGINTQGFGGYNDADSLKRYDTKAYGVYAASSKNWQTPK